MGLFLRYNLFHQVSHEDVWHVFADFYASRGQTFVVEGDDFYRITLHERDGRWSALDLDSGWEWVVRRQAQLHVSERLGCAGFLIFVYDGDYWGYEFFRGGCVIDQFVQDEEPCDGSDWFLADRLPVTQQL